MKLLSTVILCSGLACAASYADDAVINVAVLSHSQAQKMVNKAEQTIRAHGIGGAVSVVDSFGQPVIFDRLDGATLANIELAPKKAHAAVAFGQPTDGFRQKISAGNVALLGNPVALPLPGGEPIKVNGVVVGAIGVSTPDGKVDAEAAQAALSALNAG